MSTEAVTPRRLLVLSAGVSDPSSSRMLADRLADATVDALTEAGIRVELRTVDLRDHAADLANAGVTRYETPAVAEVMAALRSADAVIAITPIFNASYSGLFKTFFDVADKEALAGVPVVLGATAGTPRHSLALDFAVRPLFAYLRADVMPTAVFAATGDWGDAEAEGADELVARIGRAARELASAIETRSPRPLITSGENDLPELTTDFASMLSALGQTP